MHSSNDKIPLSLQAMATLEQYFLILPKAFEVAYQFIQVMQLSNDESKGPIANCQLQQMTLHEPSDSHLSSGD